MLRRFLLVGIASFLGVSVADPADVSGPSPRKGHEASSQDGTGAFATRKYRNLFVEAGHTEAEVEAKIAKAWKQLFEGDPEAERLFTPSGRNENGPLAYIPDIQHTDVRSEGMSYGMMIAVQLDRKAEFDALWNWSMTHMYQKDPKHPSYGFFSWQMAYDGQRHGRAAGPRRRGVLRDGALLRRASLGPRQGHLRLPGPRRPAAPRHGAPAVDHRPGAAARGRTPAHRGQGSERRARHDPVLAGRAEHLHGCLVPPARVLRALGAVGAEGGPCLLVQGGGGEPRLLREGGPPEDGPPAELRPVRRHAVGVPGPRVRGVPRGRVAGRDELVGGLVVVGEGPAAARAQRPATELLREPGDGDVR